MAQKSSFGLLLLLASLGATGTQAQGPGVPASRLAGEWRSTPLATLTTARPPLSLPASAISGVDLGVAPADQTLSRMILLLSPSAAQQQALTAELAALQNPTSSQYHQWLTPSAFANTYANSPADVAAVAAWLQSQGFQVAQPPAGRGWIEFSGTVAQVEQAFQTQIHLISSAYASARPVVVSSVSVPAALQPLISGLVSLDGVVSMPSITAPQPLSVPLVALAAETSPAGADALTPQLEAQLVDLEPLLQSGIDGAGQTIAIASRSNVNLADVAAFRGAFGLPASPLAITLNSANPGLTDGQAEATLAASWAGAAAPGAQILLVPAASTDATDGVDLSLATIIDGDLASTVAVGYSACEAGMSATHQAFYSALYRQAAAQGMAVIAAAGDNGAAACSVAGASSVDTGYSVNALASTPWDTAVGVAALGTSGTGASLSAWSPADPADPAYAGGGGSSSAYAIPPWQPLPSNLPAGVAKTNRLLPDVSLPTALDSFDNLGLVFCLSAGTASSSGCTLTRSGGSGGAASYFAGIAALMAGPHGEEGNLAPALYRLSTQSGIFSDVQQGSARLPCAAGSPGCAADGQIGYTAAAGFDLATGLGVPNATNLVRAKPQVTGTSPVTVTNNIVPGQTINSTTTLVLSATVDSGSGGTPPTGMVEFYDQSTGTNLGLDTLTPETGTTSTVRQTVTGVLAQGTHSIIAEYKGDSTYAAANSGAVTVTVQISSTTVTLAANSTTTQPGGSVVLSATVTPNSLPAANSEQHPTGTVVFYQGTTAIGSASLTASTGDSSVAALTVETLPGGQNQLTAYYQGDASFNSATSSPITVTVQAFTIAPAAGNPATGLTLTQGASGSESFLIAGLGGFSNLVQVICTPPAGDNITCATSPQQATPPATVACVVQTSTNALAGNRHSGPIWPRATGGAALAGLLFFFLPFGRRARTLLGASSRRTLVLLLLLVGLVGAGLGCTSNNTLAPFGTPLGTVTVKVTATAYVNNAVTSQSLYFTVNVVQ